MHAEVTGTKPLTRLLVLEGVQDPGNLGTLIRCAASFAWDAVWLLPGCCDPFNDKALRASRGAALRVPLVSGDWQQLLEVSSSRDIMLLAAEPEEQEGEGLALEGPLWGQGLVEGRERGLQDMQKAQQQQQQQQQGSPHEQQEQAEQRDDVETKGVSAGASTMQGSTGSSVSRNSRSKSVGNDWQWLGRLGQQPVCLVLGAEGQGLSKTALDVCRPLSIPMVGDMESLNVGVAGGILMFMLSQGLGPMLKSLERIAPSVKSKDLNDLCGYCKTRLGNAAL